VIKSYGSTAPTISGNVVSITGASSTGFSINFADIGYKMNRSDLLVFSYKIEITTGTYAPLSVKNPVDWTANPPSGGGWGIGKGWEYILGTVATGQHTGPEVDGTYNATTKEGTLEVKMAFFPASMTAIGFQHNYWAEYPSGTKIGGDAGSTAPVYKITITKIENKAGGTPPPAIDEAAFNAAVPLAATSYTAEWGGNRSITWDANGVLIRQSTAVTSYGSALISINTPAVTEALDKTADTVVIKYHAIATSGVVKFTVKEPGNSGATVGSTPAGNQYKDLTADGRLQEVSIPLEVYSATAWPKVSFQDNSVSTAEWKLKIVGVEFRRSGKKSITLRDITIPAPVPGTPVVGTITGTAQFTGTVIWAGSPAAKKIKVRNAAGTAWTEVDAYDYSTAYTPTVTLTAGEGYIFNADDIGANVFKINGTTVTNADITVSSNTLTVTGNVMNSGSGSAQIPSSRVITGIGVPVVNAARTTDVALISPDVTQYKVKSIAWKKAEDDTPLTGNFGAGTAYYAEVELETYFGYTFVGASGFTANGATVTVSVTGTADDITLKLLYPATVPTITNTEIKGVPAPAKGATPVRSINDAQYTGVIRWFRNDNGAELLSGTFAANTVYKAVIWLTAKPGFTFVGIAGSSLTIENGSAGYHGAGGTGTLAVEINPYAATAP